MIYFVFMLFVPPEVLRVIYWIVGALAIVIAAIVFMVKLGATLADFLAEAFGL